MVSFIAFIIGGLFCYIPHIMYSITLDFMFTLFSSTCLLIVFGFILSCIYGTYWESTSIWSHGFQNNYWCKQYDKYFMSIVINGFITTLIYLFSPILCIFIFSITMLINIVYFKKKANEMVNDWNEKYLDDYNIKSRKEKFKSNMKLLRDTSIFSGVALYIINASIKTFYFLIYSYKSIPTINYFTKITNKAKGFDDEKLPK